MDCPALFALGLGFALGLKHATEADHLVAVTAVVSEHRSVWRAGLVGALWGVGHTASLSAAGVALILLRVAVPERVRSLLELGVALMIITLGSRVLYLVLRRRRELHVHTHTHGGRAHAHLHFHDRTDAHDIVDADDAHEQHRGLWGWRPVAVGMVHGLAGTAALTLLVLNEVMRDGSRALGLAYLFVFGLGSVAGMLLMSALISLPFALTATHFRQVHTPARALAGLASIAFGLYYAWESAAGL
jgi:ABC-type nickel/cobalt efflux system permease component RcnA